MARALIDMLCDNREKFARNHERFLLIFRRPLRPYWSNLTGFDVVKFDDIAKPGEIEST